MTIKRLVRQLIRKHGTDNPFFIADQRNIIVLFEPLGSMMGYFNTYKRIPMIHINSDLDEPDQRFTCAHELGHAIQHPKVNTPFLRRHTLQSIDRIEREANEFAVELMVPDELLLNGMSIYDAAAAKGVPAEVAHLKKPPTWTYLKHGHYYISLGTLRFPAARLFTYNQKPNICLSKEDYMASFRKRGDAWEYRIRYADRQTGKFKEKSKGGFRTKKEAQLAAAEEELKINQFGFAENGDELISRYFDEWLEIYKRPNVKPITYSVQERNVRLNILPRWGNYRLKDLSRSEYQKWINELRVKYSEGTVRRIHSIMGSAISDAVHEFRILRENPLQRIKIPKEVEKTGDIYCFSVEQLNKFLRALTVPQKNAKYQHSRQYFALFTLIARTGLRIGEALALTWGDLDGDRLTINKTLVYPLNSQPYLSTPKTKTSGRTIKLDEFTVKVLKKHKINQKEVIIRYENYQASKDGLMFHQHDGRWLRTNVVRDYFKEVCKRENLPVLSPHALRHTHAVHLLEAGANIKYVSERLGHASVKVTADTYLHITRKIEDDALDLYSRYL